MYILYIYIYYIYIKCTHKYTMFFYYTYITCNIHTLYNMYICVWKMENIFEKVKTKLENVNP